MLRLIGRFGHEVVLSEHLFGRFELTRVQQVATCLSVARGYGDQSMLDLGVPRLIDLAADRCSERRLVRIARPGGLVGELIDTLVQVA